MRLFAPSLHCILLILFSFKAADSYYGQDVLQCYFTRDLNTIEFIYSWYFNKVEYLRYNSTADRFTGYTVYGAQQAELRNLDPQNSLYFYVDTLCKGNRDRYASDTLKKVQPEVMVKLLKSEPDNPLVVLVCSAYDYHPKGIAVSWLRDGKALSESVSSTEELSDGDWYYQTHTYLEYIPIPGEKISCVVEHESLTQPLIHTWDPPLSVDERNKLIIGIFFLVLGIILAIAGFLYYMLRAKGHPTEASLATVRFVRTVSMASSEASNP